MESMNLRARKKLLVRDVIEQIALGLFDRRGYDATTVEEIAADVGISPRTFFRYFPSKEDVVFAHHADALARLRNVLDERLRTGGSVIAAVRAAVLALREDADRRELEAARLRVIRVTPALTARRYALSVEYEAAIAAAITPALGDDQGAWMRAMLVAGAAMGAMRAASLIAATSGGPAAAAVLDDAFDLLERSAAGLSSPAASGGAPR
ncbi:MAG TPA: TetR family transcriptional regulator [Actinomycetota bacterium]|nr:TetR family transcriptional regulator [Actinomycetota bacterium]